MKIHNTSCFEKLKIRPVNVADLSIEYSFLRPGSNNPHDYICREHKIEIKPGYIVETDSTGTINEPNIWMYFDCDIFTTLIAPAANNSSYKADPDLRLGGFIRYKKTSSYGFSFLRMTSYTDNWPYHKNKDEFNIVRIFPTNINTSKFITTNDFIDFYLEHKLYDLK